uniref:G-protein coupled receptors family 1 profile domain-containing protein n=1 Tax=Gouania willdenowi TaxID=441366 RepID=A0A8C5E7V6_GOUWI
MLSFSILGVMGYDRYMAICNPLHYHTVMSQSKVCRLAILAGLYPLIMFGGFYCLTSQLSFCVKVIPKLYCSNMELVKTSCYNAPYINFVGFIMIILLIFPHLIMVFFSYAHIAKVCRKLSKESQTKALNTCIPHLLSLVNYSIGAMFELLQARFNINHLAVEVRTFMSLYFLIFPAIINPVLYALGIQLVRNFCEEKCVVMIILYLNCL